MRANGVAVEIEGDDLIVHGKGRAAGGGVVTTHMDHRIAMAALVMGLASEQPVQIDDGAFIATSFPGFVELMRRWGGSVMIIAIDGPAASGKGTIARQLAAVYGLHHLDTGLLYRAVAKAVLDAGYSPDDADARDDGAVALDPAQFDENALKLQAITEAASVVAAIPQVRQALMNYQREFATKPPGAVLDGRDIGTVIAPGADVKLFVVATPGSACRPPRHANSGRGARRRARSEVLADLLRRDERDSRRTAAPLKAAPRRALARYHAFGYRRRIPGRRRYHRGRPNGPKAQLTALSSLEVQPVRRFACEPRIKLRPDRLALGPNRRSSRRLPRVRDHFNPRGWEISWLKLPPPRRRAKISPA